MKRFILILALGILLTGCVTDATKEKEENKVKIDVQLEDHIYEVSLNRQIHKLKLLQVTYLDLIIEDEDIADGLDDIRLGILDATIEVGNLHPPKELRKDHEKILKLLLDANVPMVDIGSVYEEDEDAGHDRLGEAFDRIDEAADIVKDIFDLEE